MNTNSENVSVIGIGRLGLAWALVLEKAGYNVMGCDIRKEYIQSLNNKTFKTIEPNVSKYLNDARNFLATTDISSALDFSNIIFINVRTESDSDGKYNHSQLDTLIDSIIALGKQKETKHIVIATNVNPGFCDQLDDTLKHLNYKISFNPEFVPQGKIIEWDENPEIIIIGVADDNSGSELENVLAKVCKNKPTFYIMDRLSAEISKLALNCFLTVKISYANSIGDLAQRVGANPGKILEAIGGDSRIGSKYFKYGFGFGGPCFPRDNKALIHFANKVGALVPLNAAADKTNVDHFHYMLQDFINKTSKETVVVFDGISNKSKGNIKGRIVLEGVTYKKGTDMLDDSQQLMLAVELVQNGYTVVINDREEVKKQLVERYGDLFQYN